MHEYRDGRGVLGIEKNNSICTIICCKHCNLFVDKKNFYVADDIEKDNYNLTTCVCIKNKGKILRDGNSYKLNECVNKSKELEFTLSVNNYTNRKIDFIF